MTDRDAQWLYWPQGHETVRVLGFSELWGRRSVEVLVPSNGSAIVVSETDTSDPADRPWSIDEIAWRASATRAGHFMARGEPVALSRGNLQPLPHQLAVLDRALASNPVRLLLADEVGLGKTIEAGLIYSELKVRRRVERVLVVAPRGVQLQWLAEMRDRFGEEFALVGPAGIPTDAGINPWKAFDRVICSIDSVKPVAYRPDVPREETDRRNRERFDRLVDASWDLVIIDEAHHAAGATEGVARNALAAALAETTPNLLLLTATPHSGKPDAFARLLGLLDRRFLDAVVPTRATIAPYVIRTEKRGAVDQSGRPLFQPRMTSLETVPYGDRRVEAQLYQAVTEYVRHGYKAAILEGRGGTVLLMLLMQRIASSSTAAILDAMERRLSAVVTDQLRLFPESAETWGDLTGEEQVAALEAAKGAAWGNERAEVEILIDLAKRVAADGYDVKARFLLQLLQRLQREENDPSAKMLVFTEFTATQRMLLDMFENAGIAAVGIDGSMGLEERRIAQEEFHSDARILVSTDAGGEGVNLQFAHIVVNYDLPWNPMRIEQRIGRVDRIGQTHPVKAFNLVLENSIDARVLEVFDRKLEMILRQLGADKRDDVLNSVTARGGIEGLYAAAIVDPESIEDTASGLESEVVQSFEAGERWDEMLGSATGQIRPYQSDAAKWADQATTTYRSWSAVEDAQIDDLLDRLPECPPPEAVPIVRGAVAGMWSVWEVKPDASAPDVDFIAIFTDDSGSIRPDIAERLWVACAEGTLDVAGSEVLGNERRALLEQSGADHAYRAIQDLRPDGEWRTPKITPRLILRVTA